MTWKKLQRLLACLLAVLLLSQVGAFSPAVFAADASGYTLQDGTAIIPEGASEEKVNQILTRTLVAGFDEMSKEDQNTLLSTCKCSEAYSDLLCSSHQIQPPMSA